MLRYKTETRPGLVALYDIQPGNGAGPFLQPQRPHGALAVGFPVSESQSMTYCINSQTKQPTSRKQISRKT